MASTISYNLHQLDGFRTAASSEAGRIGSIGDGLNLHASASMFGQNGGASALSSAVSTLADRLQQEFTKAETLLRDVSRSIDAVQSAIEEADRNGKRTFTTTGGGGLAAARVVAAARPRRRRSPRPTRTRVRRRR